MSANRWRSGYLRIVDNTCTGYLTPTGSLQDVEVTFNLNKLQKIMVQSEDIQVEAHNEYLIGSIRGTDHDYKIADVIIYGKVVRLKLTEDDISKSKTLSL